MSKNFVLFVNTTDSFSDCWDPFFILFKKYWGDYRGPIYLNTEYKTYQFPDLNIISVCNKKTNWSDCVAFALNSISEEYIIYLQDDYFIKNYVKSDLLNYYFEIMVNNNFDCLHLTDQNSNEPNYPTTFQNIDKISRFASDRISCQAALWKREVILKYLIPGESGWHFETYGTQRSHYINHEFYCLSKLYIKLNEFEIIPYIFTGIVKGKWIYEVVDLFSINNIQINYADRGFYNIPKPPNLIKRIIMKIQRLPRYFYNQYLISKIRLSNLISIIR